MRCRTCGGTLAPAVTDLPFQITNTCIVIVKSVPVLQCESCGETELEDAAMQQIDEALSRVDQSAELEIIRFAA